MRKIIVLLAVVLCSSAFSQIVPFTVNLDTSITKTLDSSLIYVKNPTNKLINVTSIRSTSPFFFTRVNTLNIAAGDSSALWVIYSSYQNLTYRAFLLLDAKVPNGGLHYSLVYGLIATSKYPDVQYAFTQGLSDEPLKAALKTFTSTGAITLGYNTARDRMFETVDDYGGDTIECVYIGRKIYATNRTIAQNLGFNTEHTWPQSFFNSNDPMVSDLHHLFPTDAEPNNRRANYAFGFVVSGITYQDGGSKLGRDANNNIVFEPRDKHKGNAARSIFYFVLRHQNWGSYLALSQETALRQFHLMDTVDARERLRNDRVKQFQNNRNPFADHPELVERIAAFYTTLNTPPKAKITASPFSVKFDTLANPGDTVSYFVSICNYGNTNLTVSSVTSNNPVFTVESFPSTISANQFGYAKIKFTPIASNTPYTGELTINNSDSTMKIALNGMCGQVNGITPVSGEIPREYSLSQNYPNPFNPVTNIKFSVPLAGFVKLAVYDIMGREVNTLVSQTLKPGVYLADWNASMITSGVYFYKLTAGSFSETKRMILVK
ncbi:MAG TPA: endonuclease [Ignavibacteria bacterium]|nr:endonuclease [Ignavibacteria bacterium]